MGCFSPKIHVRPDRNLAYVNLGRKKLYLGVPGSAEANIKYMEIVGSRLAKTSTNVSLASAQPSLKTEGLHTSGSPKTESEECVRSVQGVSLKILFEEYAKTHGYISQPDMCRVERLPEILTSWYPGLKSTDIDRHLVEEFRRRLISHGYDKGDSHFTYHRTTVNKYVATIKTVLKWAKGLYYQPSMFESDIRDIKILRRGQSEAREPEKRRFLSYKEIEVIYSFLQQTYRDILVIQGLTGMRTGELTIMRWKDIDKKTEPWRYFPAHHKTSHLGHIREIPIFPPLYSILKRYSREKNYIFNPRSILCERYGWAKNTPSGVNTRLDRCNEHVSVASIDRAVHRACIKAIEANILDESWTPYFLRHHAITNWILLGLSQQEVAKLSGHHNIMTQQIYDHSTKMVIDRAAKKLMALSFKS